MRLSPVSAVVLFTMHHIVSDAWSIEVLVRDFSDGLPFLVEELIASAGDAV